jgi:hypothetical protein
MHGLEEGRRVIGAAASRFERFLYDQERCVWTGGIETGIMLIIRIDAGDEFLVPECRGQPHTSQR